MATKVWRSYCMS